MIYGSGRGRDVGSALTPGADGQARDVDVTWDGAPARAAGTPPDVRATSPQMARDCLERTREEVRELREAGFALSGRACADVCLLKGELSDEERAGGVLLGGPDGTALRAALGALGYPDACWAAVSTRLRTAGRPWAPASPEDLAWAVEVVDPELVIALDDEAAEALRAAYDVDTPLAAGEVVRVRGRRFLALGGFAASLDDPAAKQLMWARLKRVPPLGEPL